MNNTNKQAGLPPGSIVFTGDKKIEHKQEIGYHQQQRGRAGGADARECTQDDRKCELAGNRRK